MNVLLIDGNDYDREYFRHRLLQSSSEYVVTEAKSGHYGLKAFEEGRFDCVVLELELPDRSGFEVLVKLIPVARQPAVAVVVLTHMAFHALNELAMNNGAQYCLVKARTSGDELDRAIRKAVAAVGPRNKRKVRRE
ncbi:hypothetical protein W02_31770 [Nitrospira sp. KM1]|uniref:response regulator n=1 Tax=Nitrospira sp. KM1 TaxID=1936990 RepID=UPI0013A79779|nr:response regulator [Nitrospira sp. KM1]BCA56037.1 hypothetical protein W02_31770 [Nitrospira sp. KM1]